MNKLSAFNSLTQRFKLAPFQTVQTFKMSELSNVFTCPSVFNFQKTVAASTSASFRPGIAKHSEPTCYCTHRSDSRSLRAPAVGQEHSSEHQESRQRAASVRQIRAGTTCCKSWLHSVGFPWMHAASCTIESLPISMISDLANS